MSTSARGKIIGPIVKRYQILLKTEQKARLQRVADGAKTAVVIDGNLNLAFFVVPAIF
jgi:hypothetical protein